MEVILGFALGVYVSGVVFAHVISVWVDEGDEDNLFNALLWPFWLYWVIENTNEANST